MATKTTIVPIAGNGCCGCFGLLGLAAAYGALAAMFDLPAGREVYRTVLAELPVPFELRAIVLLVVGLAVIAVGTFGFVRPAAHLRIDPEQRTVTLVQRWRKVVTAPCDQVRPSVQAQTTNYKKQGMTTRSSTSYRVYLSGLGKGDDLLYDSSSKETAERWASNLAKLLAAPQA